MTFDDDMDLLDDNESPLIKDGSLPKISMDINKVFTLLAEFRGVEEEVAQMFLGPKEVMLKKRKESSQHLKPLYVRGHINGRPIARMLVDGGTTINDEVVTTSDTTIPSIELQGPITRSPARQLCR
jgi:hypothetical protein